MTTSYETDVVAWATEQASLIRAGRFDQLDLSHIAEEIEDVGKSEQRELASRMAVLLMHLLKWQFQPDRQSKSWSATIGVQRERVQRRLATTPSLRPMLSDPDWIADMWVDARLDGAKETGLPFDSFPPDPPWTMIEVLTGGWLPTAH